MDELTRAARAARSGDAAALARFVRDSQADVWRLAAHLVDRQAADDLTQEVYERAIKSLPSFRGDASARTWLLAIARRTCVDEIRRRTRVRRRDDRLEVEAATASGVDLGGDLGMVDLDDLLAGLDPDRRAAFVLTQLLGYGYAEAAEVCGCPVGTIRSRVARARADLVAGWSEAEVDLEVDVEADAAQDDAFGG